jgi:hypothetical protein
MHIGPQTNLKDKTEHRLFCPHTHTSLYLESDGLKLLIAVIPCIQLKTSPWCRVFVEKFIIQLPMKTCGSRDSSVGIATSYGLDDRGVGVRVPVGSGIFSSPDHPDRLWGPPNLLYNGYRGLFPRGKAAGREDFTFYFLLIVVQIFSTPSPPPPPTIQFSKHLQSTFCSPIQNEIWNSHEV